MKLTKRKQFKFYRSYFDVYNELSNKDKLVFMNCLLDKQFLNKEPENLTGIVKIIWTSLYHSIDTQVKGYEAKTGNILNTDNQNSSTPMQGGGLGGVIDPAPQEEEKEEVKEKDKILFIDFWNHYHKITNLPKKEKENSLKYWNKLNDKEKENACNNVSLYYYSVKDKQYLKYARTYLSSKTFNDEFEVKIDKSKLKKHVPKQTTR